MWLSFASLRSITDIGDVYLPSVGITMVSVVCTITINNIMQVLLYILTVPGVTMVSVRLR